MNINFQFVYGYLAQDVYSGTNIVFCTIYLFIYHIIGFNYYKYNNHLQYNNLKLLAQLLHV